MYNKNEETLSKGDAHVYWIRAISETVFKQRAALPFEGGLIMKKTISILLLIAICLSAFSGCGIFKDHQTVELTKQNLWQYVEVAMIDDYVPAKSEESLKCAITGALDQAIYEDVVLTFTVKVYNPDSAGTGRKHYDIEVTLNAGGNAEFEVVYAGVAQILNGKGQCRELDDAIRLYEFNRGIELTAVKGKVILPA